MLLERGSVEAHANGKRGEEQRGSKLDTFLRALVCVGGDSRSRSR
jgi:hypothetical protein